MSRLDDGRKLRANQGRTKPSVEQLARDKNYDALGKRGGLGRGALTKMARGGDRDAKEALKRLGEEVVVEEPDLGEW
jgi:hypothetical protein